MMFIGMGLYKLGILSGKRSAGWYARLMLIGYGIGIPLNTWTAWEIIRLNFDPVAHDLFSTRMIWVDCRLRLATLVS